MSVTFSMRVKMSCRKTWRKGSNHENPSSHFPCLQHPSRKGKQSSLHGKFSPLSRVLQSSVRWKQFDTKLRHMILANNKLSAAALQVSKFQLPFDVLMWKTYVLIHTIVCRLLECEWFIASNIIHTWSEYIWDPSFTHPNFVENVGAESTITLCCVMI